MPQIVVHSDACVFGQVLSNAAMATISLRRLFLCQVAQVSSSNVSRIQNDSEGNSSTDGSAADCTIPQLCGIANPEAGEDYRFLFDANCILQKWECRCGQKNIDHPKFLLIHSGRLDPCFPLTFELFSCSQSCETLIDQLLSVLHTTPTPNSLLAWYGLAFWNGGLDIFKKPVFNFRCISSSTASILEPTSSVCLFDFADCFEFLVALCLLPLHCCHKSHKQDQLVLCCLCQRLAKGGRRRGPSASYTIRRHFEGEAIVYLLDCMRFIAGTCYRRGKAIGPVEDQGG